MSLTLVSSSQSSCLSLLSARMLDIHLYVQLQPGFGAIINLDTFFFFQIRNLKINYRVVYYKATGDG